MTSEPSRCTVCGNFTEDPRHECDDMKRYPPVTHAFASRNRNASGICTCGFPEHHHFHGYDKTCRCDMCAPDYRYAAPSPLLTRIARFIPRIRGM